jgi:hypothetical protein
MATGTYPVSDVLVTVKSRQVQRAMLAEMASDREAASRHFLAAGHLELVLAEDYQAAGDAERALHSRISAASCFWRGGERDRARRLLAAIVEAHPEQGSAVQPIEAELARDYPPQQP